MLRCINISFDFKGKEYYAIVRQQAVDNKKFYKIRIMNHHLDALLHKNNLTIIDEYDGHVALPQMSKWTEEGELHMSIARELIMQLSKHETNFDYISDIRTLTPS